MPKFEAIRKLLSKSETRFEFEDYPLKTWKNPNAGEAKVAFGAGIDGWAGMVGHGETPEQAIADLQRRFLLYRENNPKLPKPHSSVPIQFATTKEIEKHRITAIDFFNRVLKLDYLRGFYSDGSSLFNFGLLDEDSHNKVKHDIIEKTLAIYDVDITDVYDGPLYLVLERIEKRRQIP